MKQVDRSPALPGYKIVRSARKTIALIVRQDGQVIVRAPRRISQERIRDFVIAKLNWILEKQAMFRQRREQVRRNYVDGEMFLFLGASYPLRIDPAVREKIHFTGEQFLLAPEHAPHARAVLTEWYKKQAHIVLPKRAGVLAAQYGLTYAHIKITSARTRWGSCSTSGTLSFTWRLIMAPVDIIDYVIVHELAHIREKNHSTRFWTQVQEMMPDYKERLRWLMENGHRLALDETGQQT